VSELAYYAVIHRPEADVAKIDEIDAKYDPLHGLVGPHVTLMFPMPAQNVKKEELFAHVLAVAKNTKPFDVCINDTELSWDQWLFLTPTVGREAFVQLHDNLYSGEFEKFWRKDLPYSPHIGVGHFGVGENYTLKDSEALPLDEATYQQALQDIARAAIDLQYTISKVEVIGLDADYKNSWPLKEFKLG
jgi:2'-5' RNA ligase